MDRFIGWQTIYGVHGEHRTPYMTRIWIGRLRLHVFHRGDADPDPHDHPWDFWTFPLTSYVEEVAVRVLEPLSTRDAWTPQELSHRMRRDVVDAWRWHHRPAEHCHRVIGRFSCFGRDCVRMDAQPGIPREPITKPGKIVTIVWRGRDRRDWGFLKNRDGHWCWTPWRDYVFGGGKHAPCSPSDGAGA